MSGIIIDSQKCTLCGACVKQCPFHAMEIIQEKVEINAACKLCRMCMKICPQQAISLQSKQEKSLDKSAWQDILVYVEHHEGVIHPVTYELIGKALELASVVHQRVHCLMIGSNIKEAAHHLLEYGVTHVDVYDDPCLRYFRVDNYANVFEDCIKRRKPSVVLVGATVSGRSLAPKVAARFKTGLTADCTQLEMRESSDLVQIRPAFGGNIMAQILNTNRRPQFATVRYKVMNAPQKQKNIGDVCCFELPKEKLISRIDIVKVEPKQAQKSISDASVLIAVGKGVKDEKTWQTIEKIAEKLKGEMACTRPIVESGRYDVTRQIGLSGRTVKPKLMITFGISGAIQFTAGMKNAEKIIAINNDPSAPIFELAHVGVVGDAALIAQTMLEKLEEETCLKK